VESGLPAEAAERENCPRTRDAFQMIPTSPSRPFSSRETGAHVEGTTKSLGRRPAMVWSYGPRESLKWVLIGRGRDLKIAAAARTKLQVERGHSKFAKQVTRLLAIIQS
jgi:hypothetical protein